MLLRFARVLLLLLLPAFAAAAQTAVPLPPGVTAGPSVEGLTEYRWPNGMRLLLVPDDSKPTTTVNLTISVGSRHENYGETGMAHLLEHMMFKGTPSHPKVWAEFEKRGLAANGSTGMDRTNYTATFSADDEKLGWYIGWLADAMVNSYVARKDLDTEMTVVRNEMEMGENDPSRTLYKKLLAAMFDWHNYGKDTIGARADVENVDIPHLQGFYHQYYQPDNATLIVSGRVVPARVLAMVAGSFGKLKKPARKLPVLYTLDPVQDGERSVTVRRVGGNPLFFVGYHTPAGADPDYAAFELLNYVMGDTPSGRLHKRLTEKQLAASTFGFSQAMAEPGFSIFGAEIGPGQELDKARAEMLATLESTATEPVSAAELERARSKWLKAWEQSFTDPQAVGMALSEYVSLGDWRLFFLLRDRVREVPLADVQRVATQYLVQSNRTLGTYIPTDKPVRAPAPAMVDLAAQMKTFHPQAAAATVEAFEATPANIDKRTQRITVGGLQAALLPKGTRGNAVQAVLVLRFGDEKSLFGSGAVGDAVGAMLDKGTQTMTREQLQDRFDQLKTEIHVGASAGQVQVQLVSRRETLPAAIALIGEMLRTPSFPPQALDEVKRQELAGIEAQRKQPEAVASNTLARAGNPYPRGDVRYARSFDEMVAEVQGVTVEQLRDFHARFYGASKGEFAAVGDFDPAAVRDALQAAFGQWKSSVPYARVPQPLIALKPERMLVGVPDNQNATMLVRQPLPLNDGDADYPALSMANFLLGGGGNSRLWKRIREGEGLSYDVRSQVDWNGVDHNSQWIGSAIFAPQNQPKVEKAFREEIARARDLGFTAQELAEGQRGLLGYRQLSRSQDASVAAGWARNLYLGRTFQYSADVDAALAKLTLADVNAALRKYVSVDQVVAVFAGDFKP